MSQRLNKMQIAELTEWLVNHLYWPYPTQEERVQIIDRKNLSLAQFNDWFKNARGKEVRRVKGLPANYGEDESIPSEDPANLTLDPIGDITVSESQPIINLKPKQNEDKETTARKRQRLDSNQQENIEFLVGSIMILDSLFRPVF